MRAILSVLLLMVGCAPVVTHSPRVQSGRDFGLVGGWRAGLCDTGCTAGLVPPIGAYYSRGFVSPDSAGAAYSISAFVPLGILFPASHVDLYAQAPAPPTQALVYGGGVSVSFGHVMPYLQAGDVALDGRGWYTTQGVVLANYRPEPEVFLNGGRGSILTDVTSTYWSPTFSYQSSRGTLFVSGAFGREAVVDYNSGQSGGRRAGSRPVSTILVGVSVNERLGPR